MAELTPLDFQVKALFQPYYELKTWMVSAHLRRIGQKIFGINKTI